MLPQKTRFIGDAAQEKPLNAKVCHVSHPAQEGVVLEQGLLLLGIRLSQHTFRLVLRLSADTDFSIFAANV